MKFCALTKLDELSSQLSPLGVHSVVTRDIGTRKLVFIEYGDAGVAVVNVTKIETELVDLAVHKLVAASLRF
jgi:hypothetical protein